MRKDNCIHITHNGGDAVGCALIIALLFPEYNFLKNTYFCKASDGCHKLNDILDDINYNHKEIPELIVISDLSIDYYTLNKLKKLPDTTKIIGIDHHETNNIDKKCDWFHIIKTKVFDDITGDDVNIAACEYMLRYFSVKNIKSEEFQKSYMLKLKKLIYIISRYDTLEYRKHPLEREYDFNEDIVSVLCNFIGPYETFRGFLILYDKYRNTGCFKESKLVPTEFEDLYSSCVLSRNLAINSVEYTTKIIKTKVITLAMFFNDNNYYKDCAEYICDNYKDIDVCVAINLADLKLYLKTNKKEMNLLIFANRYLTSISGNLNEIDGHIDSSIIERLVILYYNRMNYLYKYKNNMKALKKEDTSLLDLFKK